MPSLKGRSGKEYSRAPWRNETARHETQPFDLDYYHGTILPDIEKMAGLGLERWIGVVTIADESEEIQRLTAELAAANARIAELQSVALTAPEPIPVSGTAFGDSTGTAAISPNAAPQVEAMNYRELRAFVLSQGDRVPSGISKEKLLELAQSLAIQTPA